MCRVNSRRIRTVSRIISGDVVTPGLWTGQVRLGFRAMRLPEVTESRMPESRSAARMAAARPSRLEWAAVRRVFIGSGAFRDGTLQAPGRNSPDDVVVRHVPNDGGVGGDKDALSDLHPRHDGRIGADPGSVADGHRLDDVFRDGVAAVLEHVVAVGDDDVGRDQDPVSEGQLVQADEGDARSDIDVAPDVEMLEAPEDRVR